MKGTMGRVLVGGGLNRGAGCREGNGQMVCRVSLA